MGASCVRLGVRTCINAGFSRQGTHEPSTKQHAKEHFDMHLLFGWFLLWGLGGLGGHPFPPDRMDSALTRGQCMQFSWCSSFACACSSGLFCVEASPPQYLGFWSPSLDAHLHVQGVLGSRRWSSWAGSRPNTSGFGASAASRARAECTRWVTPWHDSGAAL